MLSLMPKVTRMMEKAKKMMGDCENMLLRRCSLMSIVDMGLLHKEDVTGVNGGASILKVMI